MNKMATIPRDGFDESLDNSRTIQGTLLKCIDGAWQDRDGVTPPSKLLVLGVTAIVQRWQDQQPVETIVRKPDKPLPGVKELNAKIPESEWEKSQIDGKPRPPWQHQEVVYLLDPASAEKFTFASGTVGAHIAVERLRDRVIWMRQLRGENVVPVVELANKPMKIKVGGKKLRPEFLIVGWSVLGVGLTSDATPQIEHAPPRGIQPIEPPTISEELNDKIGF